MRVTGMLAAVIIGLCQYPVVTCPVVHCEQRGALHLLRGMQACKSTMYVLEHARTVYRIDLSA